MSRMKELGWEATIPLREGLTAIYAQYLTSLVTIARGGA
jgi:nucleoside-diphosphate-sugar epimerase